MQQCLRKLSSASGKDPEEICATYWPKVCDIAAVCTRQLSIEASLRRSQPNRARPMRLQLQKIAKLGNLPKKFREHLALEYGARRANIWKPLTILSSNEQRISAAAALNHSPISDRFPGKGRNILYDQGGRPTITAVLTYVHELEEIYRTIAGRPLGYSTVLTVNRTGPAVRFLQACLTPILPHATPNAVVKVLRASRKK